MKALAVCATYGRLPYLGKMLSSFMHQTYDDKHLLVINDDNNIQLVCDRKDVTVINCNKRISIGEKRNIGAAFGHYDVIHPWDDDDIFYPNRIANHMKQYRDSSVRAYRNYSSYILYGDVFTISNGGMNSKSYLKSEWFRIGGYNTTVNFGEDCELYNKIQGFKIETNDDERDFMYGFGTSNYHLSNQPTNLEEIAYKQLNSLNLVGKKYTIHPDFAEYNNYLLLDNIYKQGKKDLKIKHLPNGKISISHLL